MQTIGYNPLFSQLQNPRPRKWSDMFKNKTNEKQSCNNKHGIHL